MSIRYIEYDLGQRANGYIQKSLEQGEMLGRHILLEVNLSIGHAKTFLPHDFDVNKGFRVGSEEDFNAGLGIDALPSDEWLIGLIQDYLKCKENSLIIFEDSLHLATDRHVAKEDNQYLVFENRVYRILNHKDAFNEDRIISMIGMASYWNFIGTMSSHPDAETFSDISLSVECFKTLARQTEHLIIGAFHGDSHLVWSDQK